MLDTMRSSTAIDSYLQSLRDIPFVQKVEFREPSRDHPPGIDGILKIKTAEGTHVFFVEQKRSYLDTGVLHALISQAKNFHGHYQKPLLLLARYVPAPSADQLIKAGVNFLDEAGNIHLAVGSQYERTIIGKKEQATPGRLSRITPALTQLLFALVAENEQSSTWTVRETAEFAGVSKSNVAKLRQQLVERGILRHTEGRFEIDLAAAGEELLRGYELALRPKLLIGKFRSPETGHDVLLDHIRHEFSESSIQWSLTGGAAANEVQHFYRGPELSLFIESLPDAARRRLRLMPDKSGPLVLLRSFGTLTFWKEVHGNTLAHPWLIYAELMQSPDPRAHDAAQEMKAAYIEPAHA